MTTESDIISTITDEAKRKRATELAAQPGWNPDLAALAVLSGNEKAAVAAITDALKQAQAAAADPGDYAKAKAGAEIGLLRQKIAEARARGDLRKMISLKTVLYDKYRVGSA